MQNISIREKKNTNKMTGNEMTNVHENVWGLSMSIL
jgi:hypothetical protein